MNNKIGGWKVTWDFIHAIRVILLYYIWNATSKDNRYATTWLSGVSWCDLY